MTPAERISELEKDALDRYAFTTEDLSGLSDATRAIARGEAIIEYLNGACLSVSPGGLQCERRVYHQGRHMRRHFEGVQESVTSITSWTVDGDAGAREDFITDWVDQ